MRPRASSVGHFPWWANQFLVDPRELLARPNTRRLSARQAGAGCADTGNPYATLTSSVGPNVRACRSRIDAPGGYPLPEVTRR